jgi:hypothetical protein
MTRGWLVGIALASGCAPKAVEVAPIYVRASSTVDVRELDSPSASGSPASQPSAPGLPSSQPRGPNLLDVVQSYRSARGAWPRSRQDLQGFIDEREIAFDLKPFSELTFLEGEGGQLKLTVRCSIPDSGALDAVIKDLRMQMRLTPSQPQ